MFLRNAWYLAAFSSELDDTKMVALTMLGEPVVIYRKENGAAVALEDRCCHRLAPLSLGRVEGNNLRCMYHGMLFNDQGRAIEIPGQDTIPEKARVRRYPVEDVSGWLWVWMGDSDKADTDLIPPVRGMNNPDWYLPGDQMNYACNYELINNNLTDLGHLAWVHSNSFGADESWSSTLPEVTPLARGVRINRWLKSIPSIPPLGKAATVDAVDHWAQLDYLVPGVFHFYNAMYPVGTAEKYQGQQPDKDDESLLFEHYTQQAVTPMTETTSRYFFTWGPSTRTGTQEDAEVMRSTLGVAFLEDKTIIERQQLNIDLDPTRRPMPTVHDRGVIQFQRLMAKLMAEDQAR
jgi:vanillate O-demethylase monooxygenase subunit